MRVRSCEIFNTADAIATGKTLVYSIPAMKQNTNFAFFYLLGLPEGLPFVLFCSLLGSLVSQTFPLSTIALSFTANLAIYCFVQSYKHISNAPEDACSPSPADPNPISNGQISMRTARIVMFSASLISIVSAFLLNSLNIVLIFSSIVLTLALFHPNTRFCNHPILGFNQRHFLYASIFLLNSIVANQFRPALIDIFFPLLFTASFYLLFRSEEIKLEYPQNQSGALWRISYASITAIAAAVTFILQKPVPFWTIALWVFLSAVQLSINLTSHQEPGHPQRLYLFRVFEISGVVSFLVYLTFVYIQSVMS